MNRKYDKNSPERYWDFAKLQAPPAYRDETDERCQQPGMKAIVYEGVRENGEKSRFFAYLAFPEGPAPAGGFPGVVLVHGGGGTAFAWAVRLWTSYGYAVIAPDWYGDKPLTAIWGENNDDLRGPRGESSPLTPHRSRATYRYTTPTHIVTVANLVLAHSLLLSLPEVNPEKTMYVGLSWGSWYGAMVAAVDPRFKGMLEIYLGDKKPNRKLINGRFLNAAKSPMYYVVGTNDAHGSPATMQAGFDACGKRLGNRTMIVELRHSHIGFTFKACQRIADSILKDAPGLPVIGKTTINGSTISAKVKSEGLGVKKAFLCYTTDRTEPIPHNRKWHMIEAEYRNGIIRAEIPDGVFQYYLAAYDEDDLTSYCCGSGDVITICS
ncbi:MAG: alpha/beta fold hydrolase, partial [Lentisphaeria bacterium]|nr:alpha/beta fold hydrolase [Lentisphaeria bacterium]